IRRIAEICLSKVKNWEVALAESAREGLTVLNTFKPDVILLDVTMPVMDGPAALPLLMSRTNRSVPIIFLTAKVMREEVAGYLKTGASGCLAKPFDPVSLPLEIESIVAHFQSTRPTAMVH